MYWSFSIDVHSNRCFSSRTLPDSQRSPFSFFQFYWFFLVLATSLLSADWMFYASHDYDIVLVIGFPPLVSISVHWPFLCFFFLHIIKKTVISVYSWPHPTLFVDDTYKSVRRARWSDHETDEIHPPHYQQS